MDSSPPGCSIWDSPGKNTGVGCHTSSRGSSWPRDWTQVSCIAGGFFTDWVTREGHFLKNFLEFVVIHTVKGFSVVTVAEVNVFLEFPCFLYEPMNVGNLISGSSDFSISCFYTQKFTVHVLLKPNLKDFEHYLASIWNEHNCMLVWTFFGIALLWDWNETDLFQSCGHCWVFQICWHTECSTLTASSSRILNS